MLDFGVNNVLRSSGVPDENYGGLDLGEESNRRYRVLERAVKSDEYDLRFILSQRTTLGEEEAKNRVLSLYEAVMIACEGGSLRDDAAHVLFEKLHIEDSSISPTRNFPNVTDAHIAALQAFLKTNPKVEQRAVVNTQLGLALTSRGEAEAGMEHLRTAHVDRIEISRKQDYENAGNSRQMVLNICRDVTLKLGKESRDDLNYLVDRAKELLFETRYWANRSVDFETQIDWRDSIGLVNQNPDTFHDFFWHERSAEALEGHILHLAGIINSGTLEGMSTGAGALKHFYRAERLITARNDRKAIEWDEGKLCGLPGSHFCALLIDLALMPGSAHRSQTLNDVAVRAQVEQRSAGPERRNSKFNFELGKLIEGLALLGLAHNNKHGNSLVDSALSELTGLGRKDVADTFFVSSRRQGVSALSGVPPNQSTAP